ncbi:ribosomal protein S17 (apicoplast) [Babesia ovis]|uniref:Ribosomal protein S17 n=1 Tax=Babesia ovis TaxID=5869 RepID=A0A9W5WWH8_BABOV|nr:ribosomal protein S17 [Babesia ovis]
MEYTVIKPYYKSIECHYTKYKKHPKYNKILKFNKYFKIKDVRGEFKINDNLYKLKSKFINKYD